MEAINFKCNKCKFFTRGDFDEIAYKNISGNRIFLSHFTKETADGYMHQTVCLDCLNQFKLDYKNDPLKCPQCTSDNILNTFKTVGMVCPSCKVGVIIKVPTGLSM